MGRTAIYALLSGLVLLGAADAASDTRDKFGLSDPNAPINLSADRFDADQNTKTLIYSGNAVVRQGDVFLHTDVLRVVAPDGKTPDKIYAKGHVVVTSKSGTATGDAAVYDVNPRIITLTGHVVLTHEDNVMRGEKMVVNLISGVTSLGGKVVSGGASDGKPVGIQSGNRVQGLFTPRTITDRSADDKKTAGKDGQK